MAVATVPEHQEAENQAFIIVWMCSDTDLCQTHEF